MAVVAVGKQGQSAHGTSTAAAWGAPHPHPHPQWTALPAVREPAGLDAAVARASQKSMFPRTWLRPAYQRRPQPRPVHSTACTHHTCFWYERALCSLQLRGMRHLRHVAGAWDGRPWWWSLVEMDTVGLTVSRCSDRRFCHPSSIAIAAAIIGAPWDRWGTANVAVSARRAHTGVTN